MGFSCHNSLFHIKVFQLYLTCLKKKTCVYFVISKKQKAPQSQLKLFLHNTAYNTEYWGKLAQKKAVHQPQYLCKNIVYGVNTSLTSFKH